jgi:hypothetical protein
MTRRAPVAGACAQARDSLPPSILVEVPLTSFVHDYLDRQGLAGDYLDNRPRAVRCVHPLVTLFEKVDAVARRYGREVIEADSFVRHYEDRRS